MAIPVEAMFDLDRNRTHVLDLHGVNGGGRIVATAATITAGGDIHTLGMQSRTGARHRLPAAEIAAYAIVGASIAAAAIYRLKNRSASPLSS